MVKKLVYREPKLIDFTAQSAFGACSTGSSATDGCSNGTSASGTPPNSCITGNGAVGCDVGNSAS